MKPYLYCFILLLVLSCSSSSDDSNNDNNDDDNGITIINPTNISESSISDNSATVSWSAITTSTEYQIEYGLSGFSLGSGQTIVLQSPTHTFNNLSPETSYDFYVRAGFSGEFSDWIGPNTFQTFQSCELPMSFSRTVLSNNEVEITWSDPQPDLTIEIEYGLSGFDQGSGSIVETTDSGSYILNNLQPSTDYNFYVRANCANGNTVSQWDGPYFVTTATTCNLIPTIVGIFPEFSFPEQVLIYWNTELYDNTDANIRIVVEYGLPGFALGSGTVVDGFYGNQGIVMEPLLTNTTYQVYLRAQCAEGYYSPYSEPQLFTTEE